MSSFLAILTFLLVKQFLGGLVLSREKDHTQRGQWATKAPWSLIFTPFAGSVHTGVLMVLCSSALCLVEPKHIVPPVVNLKGARFSNPFFQWKQAKINNKPKYLWINATHAKPPWGKCSLCSPSVIWSGMSSRILCEEGTFQTSALSSTMAPGHMTLLSTWNVVGVTEELNALFHTRVESLSVPRGWVTTLSASADPDWGGSCCPLCTPGTPAPSVHMAGKEHKEARTGSLRCQPGSDAYHLYWKPIG